MVRIGYKQTQEHKDKIRYALTGKRKSDQHKQSIRRFHADFSGHKNPNYRGGQYIEKRGYIQVYKPDHPQSDCRGYVYKHRLVYEEYYKCCLLPWIHIHHKNNIKSDNRIENIIPVTNSQHQKLHTKALKSL